MEINQGWRRRDASDTEACQLSFIPPMLWSQLHHSLLPFLELRMGPGGYLVFRWSHRHIKEVAKEHYLTSGFVAHKIYSQLAGYFSGALMQVKDEYDPNKSSQKNYRKYMHLNAMLYIMLVVSSHVEYSQYNIITLFVLSLSRELF